MFQYQELEDKCSATINGEMTIYTATELKQKLVAVLADPRDLEINLGGVSEIDSAGVQLLMLARKVRSADQHTLTLVEHSGSVLDAFDALGLESYFGDPVVISKI